MIIIDIYLLFCSFFLSCNLKFSLYTSCFFRSAAFDSKFSIIITLRTFSPSIPQKKGRGYIDSERTGETLSVGNMSHIKISAMYNKENNY